MSDHLRDWWWAYALGAVMVVLILIAGFAGMRADEAFRADCESKGGHITETSHTNVGVSGDGKVVTTTDTTHYCLTDDGRILAVQ